MRTALGLRKISKPVDFHWKTVAMLLVPPDVITWEDHDDLHAVGTVVRGRHGQSEPQLRRCAQPFFGTNAKNGTTPTRASRSMNV